MKRLEPQRGKPKPRGGAGHRTLLCVPLMRERRGLGAISLRRMQVRPFTEKQIALLKTFADQAAIAIQNARLFREIQEKSAQLEVANKHKSEFLANMSHELSSFHLPSALSNAMTLIRERAQRHGIALSLEVDEQLGEFRGDERKFKQIMLNLLSNAVKFTPDGGRIGVSARKLDGRVEVAVRDTGIGIAPEDQAAVFEEFRQVGRDRMRKAEGTGLGLALTKRFVELHGGAIRLESTPGRGSVFTVSLPLAA